MLALLGTPTVQRLWGIRQTGFAHLVFPGANHTRLEHSLGTYWTALRMAERLDLPIEERQTVAAAGLLHDIGHAPFSHTLDGALDEAAKVSHEQIGRSCVLGEGLPGVRPDRRLKEALEQAGVSPRTVANLIDPPTPREGRPLLRQLLHGAIDADRIDYLQRDAHYTGVAHGAIDASRLLATIDRQEGRLVFEAKGRSAIEGFLVGRALMYASVYYHKTVRAAETMAQAALERSSRFASGDLQWIRSTDGELLTQLKEEEGVSSELIHALIERRLYKRVYEGAGPRQRSSIRELLDGRSRRALEDELAGSMGAPPGAVLIDPAALRERRRPRREWQEIGIRVGRQVQHPFRRSPLAEFWGSREPTESNLSIFVHPRWRGRFRPERLGWDG
jgi:HD superfamily phosphohydrolase